MKFSQADRWKLALGCIVLIALGVGLAPSLRAAFSIGSQIRHARWPWLLAALACQAMMYVCVAFILKVTLASLNKPLSAAGLYLPAVTFLFANRAVPGPAIAGLASLVYLLARRNVSATDAQVTAGSFYLADYASFFLVMIYAAVSALMGHGFRAQTQTSYFAAAGVIVVILVFGAMIFRHSGRLIVFIDARLRTWETALRPGRAAILADIINRLLTGLESQSRALLQSPHVLAGLVGLGLLMHTLETMTLVCAAHGFGARLTIAGAAEAYVAGNLAAIVSILPGGVGFFDGAMVTALHTAGPMTLPEAGATTIMYRLLSLVVPFPFAVTSIRQALGRRDSGDPGKRRRAGDLK